MLLLLFYLQVDREVLQENGLIIDPTTISLTEEMQPSSESSDSEYSTSTTDTTPKTSTPAFHNFSLQLPGEVFANLTEDRIGLSYFLYDTASLFPVAPDSQERNFSVASPVVGVAVNGENVTNLDSPVIISLPITSVDREVMNESIILHRFATIILHPCIDPFLTIVCKMEACHHTTYGKSWMRKSGDKTKYCRTFVHSVKALDFFNIILTIKGGLLKLN